MAAFLCSSSGLAAIAGVSWLRAVHLQAAGHDGTTVAAFQPLTLLAYFSFNLLLFTVMAAYSYHVHDDLLSEVFGWRRTVKSSESGVRGAHRQFAAAYASRSRRHAGCLAKAGRMSQNVRRLTEAYKAHNLRSRKDRAGDGRHYPRCFDFYLAPDIPVGLQIPAWDVPAEIRADFAALAAHKENDHDIATNITTTAKNGSGPAGIPNSDRLRLRD